MPILRIVWLDCVTHYGWHSPNETFGLIRSETVGFVLGEDELVIRLAGSVQSEMVGDVTVIPKVLIESREVLKANV